MSGGGAELPRPTRLVGAPENARATAPGSAASKRIVTMASSISGFGTWLGT